MARAPVGALAMSAPSKHIVADYYTAILAGFCSGVDMSSYFPTTD
jgi:hypothetical protein